MLLVCVLCGDLITQVHWTDHREDDNSSTVIVGGANQRSRMRERQRRTYMTNHILSFFGLRVDDWGGSKYILSDKKGNSEIVLDLGQVWYAAEKLIHHKIDPLDTELQNYVNNSQL